MSTSVCRTKARRNEIFHISSGIPRWCVISVNCLRVSFYEAIYAFQITVSYLFDLKRNHIRGSSDSTKYAGIILYSCLPLTWWKNFSSVYVSFSTLLWKYTWIFQLEKETQQQKYLSSLKGQAGVMSFRVLWTGGKDKRFYFFVNFSFYEDSDPIEDTFKEEKKTVKRGLQLRIVY